MMCMLSQSAKIWVGGCGVLITDMSADISEHITMAVCVII